MKRREFCHWVSAGSAATLLRCARPTDDPKPTEISGGPTTRVATSCREAGDAGIVVVSKHGRAMEVVGNPDHPLSLGAVTARSQSVLQGLYSTHRIFHPRLRSGQEMTWSRAVHMARQRLRENRGRVAVLTAPLSDAAHAWWSAFLARIGGGRLVQVQTFGESPMLMASEKAFGQNSLPLIELSHADCLLSLGARFLETWGNPLLQSRQYAELRTVQEGNRATHVHLSPRCSRTGANADRWIACRGGTETAIVLALLRSLAPGSPHLTDREKALCRALAEPFSTQAVVDRFHVAHDTLDHLTALLKRAQRPVVLPAESSQLGMTPGQHHVAVLLLNKALGAIGPFFNFAHSKPHTRIPSHGATAHVLRDIHLGRVRAVLVHGLDPVHVLPPDLGFSRLTDQLDFVAALTDHVDDTTAYCDLILPVRHDLEGWGEQLSYTGMDTIRQPVVDPPHELPQTEDLIYALAQPDGHEWPVQPRFLPFLRRAWTRRLQVPPTDEPTFWRDVCQKGGRFSTPLPGPNLPIADNLSPDYFSDIRPPRLGELTLSVAESERFDDGRFSDRSWLQECPHPMTGIVWDAWVEVHPETARASGIQTGDVVRITNKKRSITTTAFVSPLIMPNHLHLSSGHGHARFEEPFRFGPNALTLIGTQLGDAGTFVHGPLIAQLEPIGNTHRLARHDRDFGEIPDSYPGNRRQVSQPDDDPIFQEITRQDLIQAKASGTDLEFLNLTRIEPSVGRHNQWGLIVDLDRCTGCGACVVACHARNRLPTVGRAQCLADRHGSWLSILRYWREPELEGNTSQQLSFMPLMCQHCQDAPCVTHCPTLAAHTSDFGTNETAARRCVGFRGCISACPYRVRRFGWFDADHDQKAFDTLNPQGALVYHGMTRTCNLCLDTDDLPEADKHPHQTACQRACPSQALHIIDVTRSAPDADQDLALRGYGCMQKTRATHPRVVYLKKIRNSE